MKIAFKHLSKNILTDVSINDLSKNLFQLGHEHEIEDDIFDMEFTQTEEIAYLLMGF